MSSGLVVHRTQCSTKNFRQSAT